MDFVIKAFGVIVIVFVISTVSGFIVWGCWDSLATAFPNLGVPKELSLWTSIKLSWLFGAMIKSSNTSSSK